ncbi:MAG: hypothetical protein IJS01_12225 [Lentisphaeria bacterium]|nr:hypothetical protein [Lentisphaeria bacterium]
MSMSKIAMLMAAALVGAGLCAADPADAPKHEGGKPAMRGGRRGPGGPGMMERMNQAFQLNDEEKAALKASDDETKTQIKAVREKAQAEIKTILGKAFDERIKTLKAAAGRLTDKKDRAKAEKMLEMMEQRRDQMLDMQAKRLLAGDRPGFGDRRGPRRDGDGPRGPRGPRKDGAKRGHRPPADNE